MPIIKVSLDDEEYEWVKAQGPGWPRSVFLRFRDVRGALTPEELIYLRDHGGTKGVIRLAQNITTEKPQVDPQTGEVP